VFYEVVVIGMSCSTCSKVRRLKIVELETLSFIPRGLLEMKVILYGAS